jgi:hypothetical protein
MNVLLVALGEAESNGDGAKAERPGAFAQPGPFDD